MLTGRCSYYYLVVNYFNPAALLDGVWCVRPLAQHQVRFAHRDWVQVNQSELMVDCVDLRRCLTAHRLSTLAHASVDGSWHPLT